VQHRIRSPHHPTMTYPRAHLVDQNNGGYYHCVSRCVRQSWLCGTDYQTGQSFEHRRRWIAKRIKLLSNLFAVDVYAYAIMSNHYHIVVRLDPQRTKSWSNETVVDRWLARDGRKNLGDKLNKRRQSLLEKSKRIDQIRSRLGSLSWFMRYINEPLARIANAEDECTGRFWEGRFKSVALLDRTALLACMIYVDLNPARANSSARVPSRHTSAQLRMKGDKNELANLETINTNLGEYLNLLHWTRKRKQNTGASSIAPKPMLLQSLNQDLANWLPWVASYSHWYRAYGLQTSLEKYRRQIGQRWLRIPILRKIQAGLMSEHFYAATSA